MVLQPHSQRFTLRRKIVYNSNSHRKASFACELYINLRLYQKKSFFSGTTYDIFLQFVTCLREIEDDAYKFMVNSLHKGQSPLIINYEKTGIYI